jgi:hypothetical protein
MLLVAASLPLSRAPSPGAPVDIEINFDSNHSTLIRLIYLDIGRATRAARKQK